MDERFLEALCNRDDHVVLGRRLDPFCLRHALWFYNLDNSFQGLFDSENAEEHLSNIPFEELEQAVYVCSTPDATILSEKWWNRRRLARFKRRNQKLDPLAHRQEFEKFGNYVKDFVTSPDTLPTEEGRGSSTPGAPWVIRHVAFMVKEGNVDMNWCWYAPYGEVMWYGAAISELSGSVEVLDEDTNSIVDTVQAVALEVEALELDRAPTAEELNAILAKVNNQ